MSLPGWITAILNWKQSALVRKIPPGNRLVWLASLAFLLCLSGCKDIEKNEQPQFTGYRELSGEHRVGQTLVARYDGLQAVTIFLSPDLSSVRPIYFKVKDQPGEGRVLRSTRLNAKDIAEPGYYRFEFPPILDSNQKYLFMEFKPAGDGSFQVGVAPAQSYMNGSLYENNTPIEAQLSFRLTYNARYALVGLLQEILIWVYRLLIALMLFVVPGWGFASTLVSSWDDLNWLEKAAISIGCSLAVFPLLLLWTDVVGVHLGALYAWFPFIAGLFLIVWRNRRLFRSTADLRNYLRTRFSLHLTWADGFLIFILIMIFATRFWAIRSLDAPMWGDSYQHSVITQLIIDHRGLFQSWLPYAELKSFTYHFGFHSLAAAYHWVTGMPAHLSVMWVGQILNACAVICLYPLAKRMNRNPWSGVAAVFFAGLLSSMPMFFVNWGRYTQLAGLVILPILAWVTWPVNGHVDVSRRNVVLSALLLAGLGLTHYRVLQFALGWLGTLFIYSFFQRKAKKTFTFLIFICIGTGIFLLPWLLNLSHSNFVEWAVRLSRQSMSTSSGKQPLENPLKFIPVFIWLLLPVSITWGLWRKNRGVIITGIWCIALFLLANTNALRLPFNGLDNFSIQISFYLPVALFLGELVGNLTALISRKMKVLVESGNKSRKLIKDFSTGILAAGLFFGALWGARIRLWDVRPDQYALVTRPDTIAFKWIAENTNPESRFLVNSFFAFYNTVIVGSDGGWWIPLLAKRGITTPPLNYRFENGIQTDYIKTTNQLIYEIEQHGLNDPSVVQLLGEDGIDHVYIGQKRGNVNSPKPLLSLDELLSSQFFQPVYHNDRIWIFELTPP